MLSREEVKTRLKYFDKDSMTGLPPARKEQYEPFMNPNFLEVLEEARALEPDAQFQFPTNGSFLRERAVKRLSELKPIKIHLSLNSSKPSIRKKVMKDPRPEVAVNSVKLLKEYGLKFIGSIVPWPTIPEENIKETIFYLDKFYALYIVLILPGYTKFHGNISPAEENEIEERWEVIPGLVKEMRNRVNTPILLYPTASWQKESLIVPLLDGVIRNSPADEAGLEAGDRIMKIDGKKVHSKPQAKLLFSSSKEDQISLELARADREFTVKLDNWVNKNRYPYQPQGYRSESTSKFYGIKLNDSFKFIYISRLISTIKKHDVGKILLISSELMKPVFLRTLAMSDEYSVFFEGVDLRIVTLGNKFWGGNIVLGDLYTIEEIKSEIEEVISGNHFEPEIIIIPSSFTNQWGLDLTGDSFRELEYRLDIPVKKLQCKQIMS